MECKDIGAAMHPRSKQWHLIDYIITRQRDLKDVHVTESMRGADCWTDHRLVRAWVSLTTQRPHRKSAPKPPRRLDTARLKDVVTQQLLSANIKTALERAPIEEGTEIDRIWRVTRNAVYKASFDSVGTTKRRHQDSFDEND